MKIAVISDLHFDINRSYNVFEELKKEIEKSGSDYLLIAGDIYEDFRVVSERMRKLDTSSSFSVLYVPGNHDLWSPEPSRFKIDYIYSFYADDERCLSSKSVVDGDVAFVGDVAWYDYSFGNRERFTDEMFDKMSYMGRTWQDGIKNPWTMENKAVCEAQLEAIENTLKKVKGKKIIALTHMLPIKEFTVLDARPEWEYFNAFLGSEKLGVLFEKYNVSYSISGHVHYRKEVQKNGVHYICPCLGYHSEWRFAKGHEDELNCHLKDSIKYIEI